MGRKNGSIDFFLLFVVLAIVVFGLIILLSASSPSSYTQFGDGYYLFKHQIIFGLIPGLGILFLFMNVPYTFWRRHAWNLLLISIALLVVVFIPGLSAGIGTAHSWISIGGIFSLQPSEIVKLTFLFYLSAWLAQRDKHDVRNLQSGFLPFFLALGSVMLLTVLQPDVGTMSIIAIMSLVVYFIAGAPVSHMISFIFAGVGALALIVSVAPYRAARLTTFLHPEFDPQGVGYHINQALLAIGSGGFFGLGYGHSRQKFQYLPEVSSDSIFAIIGEEMGFLASVLVVGVFLLLFWRMIHIALHAPDNFAKYVVSGVCAWLIIQAFVNIGSMIAIMPITGVPLPFISYGGTSLAISMAAVGVVLNISKHIK